MEWCKTLLTLIFLVQVCHNKYISCGVTLVLEADGIFEADGTRLLNDVPFSLQLWARAAGPLSRLVFATVTRTSSNVHVE